MITIVRVSNRKFSNAAWFFESLDRELGGDYEGVKVVLVDFWAQVLPDRKWGALDVMERKAQYQKGAKCEFLHVPPKPCVWQGPHRLTQVDYAAFSAVRNTGLCYAEDGHVVFVDDLSVLMPGWWYEVKAAVEGGWRSILRS